MLIRNAISAYATWYKLLKASWHTAAASIISNTLTAVTVALAGRALGASAYGSVVAIGAYFGWFTLISCYPCAAPIPSFLASEKETDSGKRRAMGTVLAIKSIVVMLGAICAYGLMFWLMPSVWYGPLRNVALVYLVILALPPLIATIDIINQSMGWLRVWSISSTFGAGIPVIALLFLGLIHIKLDPLSYICVIAATTTISAAFTFLLLVRVAGGIKVLKPRMDLVLPFYKAGKGVWLSVLGGAFCLYGVKTILANNVPSSELGRYDVAFNFLVWVTGLGISVTIPALSEWSKLAAQGNINELRRDLRRRQRATAVVMGTVSLICLFAARPILLYIYGADYVAAATVLRILGMSLALGGAGCWYWIAVYALGQPWRIGIPNIISGCAQVVATYLLVRFTGLGIIGAAIAYVASVAIWLALYEWEFRRALSGLTSKTVIPAGLGSP